MYPGEVLFQVDPRRVAQLRRRYALRWVLSVGVFVVMGLAMAVALVAFPSSIPNPNPLLLLFLFVLLTVGAAFSQWANYYRYQRINSVAVTTRGIAPPFKPRRRSTPQDWFVPYSDIVSMSPDSTDEGFWPTYVVDFSDGSDCRLSPYDVLWYVKEREADRYAALLDVIHAALGRPSAQFGGGVMIAGEIPRGYFQESARGRRTERSVE